MSDSTKFVLMVLPIGRQGKIWQAVLRSQNISVLWESIDINLPYNLLQLQKLGIPLPDLILLDTRLQSLNPYRFCRWSRSAMPELKVVLTNGLQTRILPSEQAWARQQGAIELLPRFDHEHLVTGGIYKAQRILEILEIPKLNQGPLVSALLHFSRTSFNQTPANLQEREVSPLPITAIPQ